MDLGVCLVSLVMVYTKSATRRRWQETPVGTTQSRQSPTVGHMFKTAVMSKTVSTSTHKTFGLVRPLFYISLIFYSLHGLR